jgi:hypothetical protein
MYICVHPCLRSLGRNPLCRRQPGQAGIGQITKHLIPLMSATVAMLFLITYFPGLTRVILWLLAR